MPDTEPIKTHKEIWGTDFPIGGEWDAGATPPLWPHYPSGRWTVRREENRFVVIFHRFQEGKETELGTFPPTEEGELNAKTCALEAQDILRFS
jgi:hypothetical protein